MLRKKFLNVLGFYWNHLILKEKERTGWIQWNVSGRRESVADHVSSTQALAFALYSEFDELEGINIEHVLTLLAIHEEAEAKIGDITPYQGIDPEEKARREREAYASICSYLKRGNYLYSLFNEFEAKETPEAKFAYLCDKLECDLQARNYDFEGRCTIANSTYENASHPKIQKIISNGAKTVWDVFWEADKSKYEGTFLEEFFTFLKDLE